MKQVLYFCLQCRHLHNPYETAKKAFYCLFFFPLLKFTPSKKHNVATSLFLRSEFEHFNLDHLMVTSVSASDVELLEKKERFSNKFSYHTLN